jgi:NAD(P)-dependent dehydrogenase (short-subunit alcohol dehydrogenase family)
VEGRVALVTGASRGIGAAIARRLAAEGAAVAITARTVDPHPTLPGTLREVAELIRSDGGTALAIPGDLTDPGSRAAVAARVRDEMGPVDILVNNAAASFYLPFAEISEKRFRIAYEVNVRAPFDLAQRVLPDMRARGRGFILNISSRTATQPAGPPFGDFAQKGGALLYGSTKAALDRFSVGLAAEVFADGIAVNALSPVAAVMTPGAVALGVVPEAVAARAEPVEAMAEAALALCVPHDPMLTGRIAYSLPILEELSRPVRSLDGRRTVEA